MLWGREGEDKRQVNRFEHKKKTVSREKRRRGAHKVCLLFTATIKSPKLKTEMLRTHTHTLTDSQGEKEKERDSHHSAQVELYWHWDSLQFVIKREAKSCRQQDLNFGPILCHVSLPSLDLSDWRKHSNTHTHTLTTLWRQHFWLLK